MAIGWLTPEISMRAMVRSAVFPYGWHEINHWSHRHCFPESALAENWGQSEKKYGTQPSGMDAGVVTTRVNISSSSLFFFFKKGFYLFI